MKINPKLLKLNSLHSKDILENEDIHLDDMFIASLVVDLVKVRRH